MIPNDLRHLPEDPFQLIAEEAAGWLVAAILFLCWLSDRMGWLL